MDTKNTDILQNEAIRLLNFQCLLLRKLLETPGLLNDASSQEKSSLTLQRAREDMQVLEGELDKLQDLDMVLAVVGTMKSGKSTTNNAIVGMEVLPSRYLPMTALPTLIRHTPGAEIPELYFQKSDQLNKLIKELKEKMDSQQGQQLLEPSHQLEDLVKLADSIRTGYEVKSRYKNESGIFEFLKSLNDLVRLSMTMDVKFPFEEFKEVKDLPVIEVEFQHLRDKDLSYGRLSLLDTPGPNEEGQFALKSMMKEQLHRASGVIAVLDYTQLKSDSDEELRRELLEIVEVCRGRLSILVNKIDQQDGNSDSEETVQKLVANHLLKGRISEENVYPVSSRYACLASRARTALAVKGKLSCYEQESWVEDFGKRVFGLFDWRSNIDDIEKVNAAIDVFWRESRFDKLLTQVIKKTHSQAAVMAIDSASAKLVESGIRVNNFLGLRETALQKSNEELKNNIKNIKNQIERVNELENRSIKSVKDLENELKDCMAIMVDKAGNYLRESLDQYFEEGNISACEEKIKDYSDTENARRSSEARPTDLRSFITSVFSRKGRAHELKDSDSKHFDPKKEEIEFQSQSSAQQLLDDIYNATQQQYQQVQKLMSESVDTLRTDLDKLSQQLEHDALVILKAVSAELNKEDFELKLRLPDVKPVSIKFSSRKVLDDMVEKETRTEKSWRRSSGLWGTVCGWFNTYDWGFESYSVDNDYFKVNVKQIREQTLDGVNKIFTNANQSLEQNIIKPVEASCSEFFTELKETIDEIRGDLLSGLKDSERTKMEQQDLSMQLANLKIDISDSAGDMEQLNNDTGKLLRSVVVTV